jgi:ATP-dependent DNA helicase DinG
MIGGLSAESRESRMALPDVPVLVAGLGGAVWLSEEGEFETIAASEAQQRIGRGAHPMVVHMRATARRLGITPFAAHDLLELFAFVQPARFCLPTPRGLARALALPTPDDAIGEALLLQQAARRLLATLSEAAEPGAARIARSMAEAGWSWGEAVRAALADVAPGGAGFAVWQTLPLVEEQAPEPAAGHLAVDPEEARRRLAELVGRDAEARPSQADYASAASLAFRPRDAAGEGAFLLAEAGTGVGKTLGYIAPASLWAEKNEGPVWISTYTRNLQQQISSELDRLYPDPALKSLKAVVRKGRENYLCLLNYDEATAALRAGQAVRGSDAILLGLLARWIERTGEGDLSGGDFPGWLPDLLGRPRSLNLSDRRGECIYSACPHFRCCFIERSVRRARRAEIVVANHALVMMQAALGGVADDPSAPTRFVFDEGHHLFDAADSAFSGHLTLGEGIELRRWLLGAEAGGKSRARGLRRRVEDLIADEAGAGDLAAILQAARALPAEGALARLTESAAAGPVDRFLALVRGQLLARSKDGAGSQSLETETAPAIPGLAEAAAGAAKALQALQKPMGSLRNRLLARLDQDADLLDSDFRLRIESIARSLERRRLFVAGWIGMLESLDKDTPAGFVDWFSLERLGEGARQPAREIDVGMHRHHLDPTLPFVTSVAAGAHGLLVTSATLTDGTGDAEADWKAAEARTGAAHLGGRAMRAQVPSPFDYPAQTRVFVVTDVRREDAAQIAAAYRVLFLASGGGALGLFTAIRRLRAVHAKLSEPLERAGIPLLAQHVDALETSSLIDIFRAEEDACLLGTDAVRDGVDVPGRSLRLIVFDRVPWPRPDILHKARRKEFGGAAYDDMLTRLRLKQAFGRLVRRADDHGIFVLLDPRLPTRLCGAFPPGVEVQRIGLAQAVEQTRAFLNP